MANIPVPDGYEASTDEWESLMIFEGHLGGNEGYPEDSGYASKEANSHRPGQGVIGKSQRETKGGA